MSSASRRHTRTRVRSRSSRPHVEGLEARLAAGTVIDLFGSTGAGLGIFGQPGEPRPSNVETSTSPSGPAASGDPAVTFPGHFLVVCFDRAEDVRRAPRSEPAVSPILHRKTPSSSTRAGQHPGPRGTGVGPDGTA